MGFSGKDIAAVASLLDGVNDVALLTAINPGPLPLAVGVQLDQPAVLRPRPEGTGFAADDVTAVIGQDYGMGEFVCGSPQDSIPPWHGLGRCQAVVAKGNGRQSQQSREQHRQPQGFCSPYPNAVIQRGQLLSSSTAVRLIAPFLHPNFSSVTTVLHIIRDQ